MNKRRENRPKNPVVHHTPSGARDGGCRDPKKVSTLTSEYRFSLRTFNWWRIPRGKEIARANLLRSWSPSVGGPPIQYWMRRDSTSFGRGTCIPRSAMRLRDPLQGRNRSHSPLAAPEFLLTQAICAQANLLRLHLVPSQPSPMCPRQYLSSRPRFSICDCGRGRPYRLARVERFLPPLCGCEPLRRQVSAWEVLPDLRHSLRHVVPSTATARYQDQMP